MIIGIGVDFEEVDRIREAIQRHGDRFVERIFTSREIAYVEERANRFERYAVRFAAKEAAMKALGTGWSCGVSWLDCEVVNDADGRPRLELHGRARAIADQMGCRRRWVSLSHTHRGVIAQVVLEGD
jgi:holo-[acyl-carrier protein] synthase